jgi:hypothetical protein
MYDKWIAVMAKESRIVGVAAVTLAAVDQRC